MHDDEEATRCARSQRSRGDEVCRIIERAEERRGIKNKKEERHKKQKRRGDHKEREQEQKRQEKEARHGGIKEARHVTKEARHAPG